MEENYKDMYLELFNRVSAVIEDLKDIQRQTEKMYVEARGTAHTEN